MREGACLQKREEAEAGICRQVHLRLQLSFQVGSSAQVAALKQAVAQGYHILRGWVAPLHR